jgi:AraC family transcriptional regulator of adaptative response / DNA-3-methyladenine glycosylase II
VILRYNPPYDWAALLKFFAARAIPGVDEVEGHTYRRTFTVGRVQGCLSVTPAPGTLSAEIAMNGKVDADVLTQKLRRLFDLDAPGKRIAAHLRRDETLAQSLKKRPGLRVPGVWDPFELGVRAILGQQVSVAAASTLAGRIATKFGKTAAKGHATLTRLFPKTWRMQT